MPPIQTLGFDSDDNHVDVVLTAIHGGLGALVGTAIASLVTAVVSLSTLQCKSATPSAKVASELLTPVLYKLGRTVAHAGGASKNSGIAATTTLSTKTRILTDITAP
jgi:hypothetical protein